MKDGKECQKAVQACREMEQMKMKKQMKKSNDLSDYEQQRLECITRNNAKLAELGLLINKPEKKKRSISVKQRRSVVLDGPKRQNPNRAPHIDPLDDDDKDNEGDDDEGDENEKVLGVGRWNSKFKAHIYYAGLTRHIGYYKSRENAVLASKAARECMISYTATTLSLEQIKRNIDVMRKAANEVVVSENRRIRGG